MDMTTWGASVENSAPEGSRTWTFSARAMAATDKSTVNIFFIALPFHSLSAKNLKKEKFTDQWTLFCIAIVLNYAAFYVFCNK
jgi:hypothetical protein